jgi:hypothetical protein
MFVPAEFQHLAIPVDSSPDLKGTDTYIAKTREARADFCAGVDRSKEKVRNEGNCCGHLTNVPLPSWLLVEPV